jgi:hypothetical protein
MNEEAAVGIVNLILLIAGAVMLSYAFGWLIGTGVACLVAFHKTQE